ncbi:hypothetical protein CMI47_13895 [Candidatus Pacearchaeota archaeon]|nr:hypothetical protein [Candidatus Pacearchaeota archaeon]
MTDAENLKKGVIELGATAIGKAPEVLDAAMKFGSGRSTDTTREGYPRDNSVITLKGAQTYPSGITTDPLGYVSYMPYEHGKSQAGDGKNPLQINLHMPRDLTDSVTAKWEAEEDLFAKTGQLGFAKAIGGTAAKKAQELAGEALGAVTLGVIDGEAINKSFQRQRGHAVRPFESQFFQGVDYRSFEFTHKLVAFSQEETYSINKIIKILRYYSSPDISLTGISYTYPASWRIRFFHGSSESAHVRESEWLPSLKRCVLGKVEVKHFASNTPSYHTNLAPVDIEISLSFREMEYVTRKSILNETQPKW